MNKRTIAEIIGGVLLFALLTTFVVEWHHKQIELAVAQTKVDTDKAAEAKIDAAAKVRDAEFAKQQAIVDGYRVALDKMTSAQIVAKAPIFIPNAPTPIQIVGPDTQPAKLGDAIVPQADIKPIAAAIVEGEQCKLDRAKCQASLGDFQEKLKLQEDQTAQWKTVAKGGSVWKRVKKVAICVGIGAAIGYAAHR